MPNSKDTKRIQKVFRNFLREKKRNKYKLATEIFPEIKVRKFLGISNNALSCCDGLAERLKQYWMNNNLKDYGLLELKGKNFDTRHGDIGQFQLNETILTFKKDMNAYKGYSFIKEGGWLTKKGFKVRNARLYRIAGGSEEKLIKNVPLRIYYYDNQYNVYKR